jgi:hypothetical protein
VVAEGHFPLPYHSTVSISPSSSVPSQKAGQAPAVKQFNLIRASQVWPTPPRHELCTLPL